MLGNCPNLVRDSLYVVCKVCSSVFNHERCSLSGSTVYPGARFGVSLKLLYPEADLLSESFCCRSCWLHASCGVEGFYELLPGSNNRLQLVRTPAGRFHMWAGASQSLERLRLLKIGGGRSWLRNIAVREGGWVLITVDYGGGRGVKNAKKNWLRNMWTSPYDLQTYFA